MMRVVVGTPIQPSHTPKGEDIEWEEYSTEEMLSLATTSSLFGETRVFRFDGALSGAQAEDFLAQAHRLALSPHQFIFTEAKLLKKITDALTKAGAVVESFPLPKKQALFDVFSLSPALMSRDRKKLWLLVLAAAREGIAPEALVGVLHYAVRRALASPTKRYTREELMLLSRQLVSLYHDSHRGAGDLSLLLERFVLLLY